MNDNDRKDAALFKMAERVFPNGVNKARHYGRDVRITTFDEVTLTAVETMMALLEPASVTLQPRDDQDMEVAFLACRKLPWEL